MLSPGLVCAWLVSVSHNGIHLAKDLEYHMYMVVSTEEQVA